MDSKTWVAIQSKVVAARNAAKTGTEIDILSELVDRMGGLQGCPSYFAALVSARRIANDSGMIKVGWSAEVKALATKVAQAAVGMGAKGTSPAWQKIVDEYRS
jgi:hypothetical protein